MTELPLIGDTVIENYAKPQMFRRIRNFSAPHSLRSLRCSTPLRSRLRSGRLTVGYLARFVALALPNPRSARTSDTRQPLNKISNSPYLNIFHRGLVSLKRGKEERQAIASQLLITLEFNEVAHRAIWERKQIFISLINIIMNQISIKPNYIRILQIH